MVSISVRKSLLSLPVAVPGDRERGREGGRREGGRREGGREGGREEGWCKEGGRGS